MTGADAQRQWLARKRRDRAAAAYRSFVGPSDLYDVMGALQFALLTHLGLREHHYLLDVGCGSLRAGRLFIPYLLAGRYCGTEPERWLVEEGIRSELGDDIRRIKRPRFSDDPSFTLSAFGQAFDFILAHSIFSHASQGQIRQCLAEARKVMMPHSIFVATFVPGAESYAGDDWVHCARYTPDRIAQLAREQALHCEPIQWPHPTAQRWLLLRPQGAPPRPLPAPIWGPEAAAAQGRRSGSPGPGGALGRAARWLRRAGRRRDQEGT